MEVSFNIWLPFIWLLQTDLHKRPSTTATCKLPLNTLHWLLWLINIISTKRLCPIYGLPSSAEPPPSNNHLNHSLLDNLIHHQTSPDTNFGTCTFSLYHHHHTCHTVCLAACRRLPLPAMPLPPATCRLPAYRHCAPHACLPLPLPHCHYWTIIKSWKTCLFYYLLLASTHTARVATTTWNHQWDWVRSAFLLLFRCREPLVDAWWAEDLEPLLITWTLTVPLTQLFLVETATILLHQLSVLPWFDLYFLLPLYLLFVLIYICVERFTLHLATSVHASQ